MGSVAVPASTRSALAAQQWNAADGPLATFPFGATTPPIALPYGTSRVGVRVTAENLINNRVYMLSIHRQSPSTTLQGLTSSVSLFPVFSGVVTSYSQNVSSSVASIALTPVLSNTFARMLIDAWSRSGGGGGGAGVECHPTGHNPQVCRLGTLSMRVLRRPEAIATDEA